MDAQTWILEIHHRHGSDISAHTSEARAQATLTAYVDQWWAEVAGGEYGGDGHTLVVPADPPADADKAVAIYFGTHPSEWFDLHANVLVG